MFKLHKKEKETASAPSYKITKDTIIEHRRKVIAEGRRFKYPFQYSKHKLVFNTIIISFAALIVFSVFVWQQLYIAQNSSDFFYSIARIFPLPVAKIDGENVLFSDYLMKYRSAVFYLENKEQVDLSSADGKKQVAYVEQQSYKDALADAYVKKVANKSHITVSDQEVNDFIKNQNKENNVQQSTYEAVIKDYYNWSPSEYKQIVKEKMLRQRVSYLIDGTAKKQNDLLSSYIVKNGSDKTLKNIVEDFNKAHNYNLSYAESGIVLKSNHDYGLTSEASLLNKNEILKSFKTTSGDGYYFIQLLDKNSTNVNYGYVKISLTQLSKDIDGVEKSGKVVNYIKL
jgi:hypothetical protein